jgi:hypothetical protein
MAIKFISATIILIASALTAQQPVIVTLDKVDLHEHGVRKFTLHSSNAIYVVNCDTKDPSCQIPSANKRYYVFDKNTSFTFPNGGGPLTLAYFQDEATTYPDVENISLHPLRLSRYLDEPSIYRVISIRALPRHRTARH